MTRSLTASLLLLCFGFACTSSAAAQACPPTDRQQAWSNTCFAGSGATRHVKSPYITRIKVNGSGFATISIGDPPELVAVDRTGVVTIPHIVHTGDYDFPGASAGLGRFHLDGDKAAGTAGKCGYFDSRTFTIIIAPVYDHCMAAQSGTVTACVGCASYCVEAACQSRTFVGGHAFEIDKHGAIVRRFAPPPLDSACGGIAGKRIDHADGRILLQCPAQTGGPFDKLR